MRVDKTDRKEIISNQTIIAFFIGLFFSFLSISIDLIFSDLELTIGNLGLLFKENPVHWITASAPIVLAFYIFLLLTKYVSELYKATKEIDEKTERELFVKKFTQALINNNFDEEVVIENDDDIIGIALDTLRNTLKNNKEEEAKRRKEEELRNWMAEGLAMFGDILRKNNDNPELLAFNIISNLTKHLDAIQGGFYLLNDDDASNKHFKLISFYAYERKKYANQTIKWGEGLIGTCAIEGKTIYMKELPNDYVRITSGLGQANPNTLLLIPLLYEGELHGVLEIASLNEFNDSEIDFTERLGVNIANTYATLKNNVKTSKLLEESQMQAEALASQEEEMRQNMEELQATQEEAARQSKEFINLSNTVNHTLIRAEYDTEGTLLYANTKFLQKLEYSGNREVEGKSINMFLSKRDEEWFQKIWETLATGGRHFEGYMKHITKSGKDLWTMATYTCVRNEEGGVDKILFLGLDTTEQKKLSLNLEGIVDAVNRSNIKIEFDVNGNFLDYNESFINLFKFTPKEVAKLNVYDLLDKNELETFNKKWENIINGMGFQGELKTFNKDGEERWISTTFSAVYDMYNEVDRVIFIGHDTTKEKIMEIATKEQSEQLRKQEKQLREAGKELSKKLTDARNEMKAQFKEVEKLKLRQERTLEGALDAIVTINKKNKIEFFNQAAENMWGYKKKDVMGKDISMLFEEKNKEEDEFAYRLITPDTDKIVGERKEINIIDSSKELKPALVLLSEAVVENEVTYTAFIQNIEVELF
jgi:PAS domain S-box-containing protein